MKTLEEQRAARAAYMRRWRVEHPKEAREYSKRYHQSPKGRAARRAAENRRIAAGVLVNTGPWVRCDECHCTFYAHAVERGEIIRDAFFSRWEFVCEDCVQGNIPLESQRPDEEMLLAIEEEGEEAAAIRYGVEQGLSLACRLLPSEWHKEPYREAAPDWFRDERRNREVAP